MSVLVVCFIFFFTDTAPTEIYTLSLHDALPICLHRPARGPCRVRRRRRAPGRTRAAVPRRRDRKSTRLNSSHMSISYAVFCLKKKKKKYLKQFLIGLGNSQALQGWAPTCHNPSA